MKLLIDLSGCDMPYSSITVYSMRVLRGFLANGIKDITILCNTAIYNKIIELVPRYKIIPIEMSRRISLINVIRGYFRWRNVVKRIDYDVIYLPHPFPPYHCIWNKGKIVTTILDIEGLRAYHGIKLVVFKYVYPLVIKKSHRLTTISEFVKQDVLNKYPSTDINKIQTVHCSVIIEEPQIMISPFDGKYILYVSSFLRHKNVMTLIKAFNHVKDKISHQLVLIGRKNDLWCNEVVPFIEDNHLENRIVLIDNGVTDEELSQYYKFADIFVHPSYMEGFGYPPIEAAILKTPVITTRVTSLYETTMGLLNYYNDPMDDTELANKMLDLLENKPSQEQLDKISDIYKSEYHYQKVAKALYNELLKVQQ